MTDWTNRDTRLVAERIFTEGRQKGGFLDAAMKAASGRDEITLKVSEWEKLAFSAMADGMDRESDAERASTAKALLACQLEYRSLKEDAAFYKVLSINAELVDWKQVARELILYVAKHAVDLINEVEKGD